MELDSDSFRAPQRDAITTRRKGQLPRSFALCHGRAGGKEREKKGRGSDETGSGCEASYRSVSSAAGRFHERFRHAENQLEVIAQERSNSLVEAKLSP
jgi:hypothetical protein